MTCQVSVGAMWKLASWVRKNLAFCKEKCQLTVTPTMEALFLMAEPGVTESPLLIPQMTVDPHQLWAGILTWMSGLKLPPLLGNGLLQDKKSRIHQTLWLRSHQQLVLSWSHLPRLSNPINHFNPNHFKHPNHPSQAWLHQFNAHHFLLPNHLVFKIPPTLRPFLDWEELRTSKLNNEVGNFVEKKAHFNL